MGGRLCRHRARAARAAPDGNESHASPFLPHQRAQHAHLHLPRPQPQPEPAAGTLRLVLRRARDRRRRSSRQGAHEFRDAISRRCRRHPVGGPPIRRGPQSSLRADAAVARRPQGGRQAPRPSRARRRPQEHCQHAGLVVRRHSRPHHPLGHPQLGGTGACQRAPDHHARHARGLHPSRPSHR